MNKGVCWLLGILTGMVTTVGAEAIVVAAVPTKVYLNDLTGQTIVGENIGNRGLLDVILNINQFTFDDVPMIETLLADALKQGGMGDLIAVDYEVLRNVHFTDPQLSEKVKQAIKITATLKSLGVNMGRFGDLEMFQKWMPVTPTAEDIKANPQLYYYSTGNGHYARAFNDDGTYCAGVNADTPLFYANLSEVVVTDLFTQISARIPQLTVDDFVTQFLGSDALDPKLSKAIGATRLVDLGNLSVDDFLLGDFIDNWDMLSIVADMTGKEKEEVTIGDLNRVSTENIHLNNVIPWDRDSDTLYELLTDATGLDANDITIGDLHQVKLDNCHLSTVIDPEDPKNARLYQMLSDITGKAPEDILVGDMNSVDIGKAKLTSFVPYEGNEKLYQILLDVTEETDYTKLTLNVMDGSNMGRVKLMTFVDPADNATLYEVLLDMIHEKSDPASKSRTAETIILDDLRDLDFTKVRLSSVWGTGSTDNTVLAALLKDDTVTIGNLGSKIDALTIYDLFGESCFTTDKSEAFAHYEPGEAKKRIDVYDYDGTVYTYNTQIDYDGTIAGDHYYVSKNAGIWLLLAYDATTIDGTCGRTTSYTASTKTFGDLQNNASVFSGAVGGASIYQLIAAGILEDKSSYNNATKAMTIDAILALI